MRRILDWAIALLVRQYEALDAAEEHASVRQDPAKMHRATPRARG